MSVKEILEYEKRNEENKYEVHMFLEGNWWRAYEVSAYLITHTIDSKDNSTTLKPTKKQLSDNTQYVMVGLQLSSFGKYLPSIDIDKAISKIDDKHIVFNIENVYVKNDNENISDDFINWKNGIQLKEKSKDENIKIDKGNNSVASSLSLFSIAKKILEYQLHEKSPNENMKFIGDLKQNILKIIL